MTAYNEKKLKLEGMCEHGNFPPCELCRNLPISEQEKNVSISLIDPEDKMAIADYYKFEVKQGFSTINPKTTFEKMVDFRQSQLRGRKLSVAIVKEGDKIVSTGVVVLENGTMGRELESDEAGAGGVVVSQDKRNAGIGEMMASHQIQIAKESGKESIVSYIDKGNAPSFRLHLKLGYKLESIRKRPNEAGDEKIDFKIRNNFGDNQNPVNWIQEVSNQHLSPVSEINESSQRQILIDSDNDQLIEQALAQGYQGVHLLRPKDFGENKTIERNFFVFTKE
jgi:L-amino acid N-acyltransferase YncA